MSQVLNSIGPTNTQGEKGAARRLTKKLASSLELNGTVANVQSAKPAQQDGVSSMYTVTYAPNYQEDHTLSKVSDFDSRLTLIEAALGIDAIPLPSQDRSASKAMIPTLDFLDKQLHTLSTSTDSSLDKISRRVRHLTVDAEKLERARKSAKAAQDALSPTSSGPRSAGLSSEAGVLEIDDHESMSKINALYGTLSTIESLAPLLPSLLDRLRSLRTLHTDAATASQTLSKVESRQEAMKAELEGWKEGLEKVEKAKEQGEQTVKSNTEMVDGWVKELEERMRNLG